MANEEDTSNDATPLEGGTQAAGASEPPTMSDLFDGAYASSAQSPTMGRIFQEVYGDDMPPAEVAAFSFVSLSELQRLARELQLGPGQAFVDLACGGGGPGLWVTRETGADLVGIDISPAAVEQAAGRALQFGLNGRASFKVGDFAATGLPEAAFDGAISIDALWLAFDKLAALREAARILRPGARFLFTTWEMTIPIPDFPPQVDDHRPLLHEAGFEVEDYGEAPDWERRQRGVYAGILASQAALIQERGEEAAGFMIQEAQQATGLLDGVDYLAHARRVFIVARRI
jgi:SAM-dependent methyltransferase